MELVGEEGVEGEAKRRDDTAGGKDGAVGRGSGRSQTKLFPPKLTLQACRRFLLRQTLKHIRDRPFPVKHSQLKVAVFFLSRSKNKEPADARPLWL